MVVLVVLVAMGILRYIQVYQLFREEKYELCNDIKWTGNRRVAESR
ncbi:hypothetical protein SDC9_203732 [bioreactor metagenome]|uniref:Uncharacterized protein n=1 Tax=bioreactor metagenome TaxID=1076179 RepID=A0A645IXZ3_9ZZZZ